MNADANAAVRADVLGVLKRLRAEVSAIEGGIVATTDGILISHDLATSTTYGVEPEAVAALAAVNLGLSARVTDTASHGDLQETIIRGALGQVVTYPAGERTLLTILVGNTGDIGLLHGRARLAAERIGDLVKHMVVPSWPEQDEWER